MKKNIFSLYFFAAFAFLIPAPARFAHGILILLGMNLLVALSFALSLLLKKLHFAHESFIIHMIFALLFAAGYSAFLQLVAPVAAFSMQFSVYLAIFSPLVIVFFKENDKFSAKNAAFFLSVALCFDIFAFVFIAMRDILGFGSLAVIHGGKMFELKVFGENWRGNRFFASIPFAAMLTSAAAFFAVYALQNAKFLKLLKKERNFG